ncbi:alpha/beta hydrolase [Streptomyces verrucosisporus]|uniref:alpha/beta hydrolase n=1 Tax=Streptomyces verrucosisporus TaxID=1695161 RepID=UPI0019D10F12|nr:alpha/beta hydrolase [Streptomyces verrucosisporus]MBN3928117.1 alpha/beta hydrolase [Streptomyces verrucosisporus]
MTAFVLVPGAHTGGWVWEEVAGRLRESGAEAHPVTLTGMCGPGDPAGAGTDLETHIDDLVRLIDGLDALRVVLVGHCYGIHPALGAAGRRPERIARIVHLDTGIPRDGAPALALVPDGTVRERLSRADGLDGGLLPPPPPDGWRRWGSTAGVPEEALERLARLAAPQPADTLTRPLRLNESVSRIPATGVLCTANGPGIAAVEAMVGLGDPRFPALTGPRVGFFELATGHWPMLSAPGELAGVLLRAAAGEGHRISPPQDERPAHLRPFIVDVPEARRERTGRVDLHLPEADGPRPAVVFVHGGPVPPEAHPTPRDWPVFTGYARYAASLGAVGATVDHRLHDIADYGRAAEDVRGAVRLVRADPRVDGDRIALWFFSGGGPLSADWLAAPPPWLRCLAATYPLLAPPPGRPVDAARFHPATALRTAGRLPVVLTRVALELPELAATVQEFLAAAEHCEASVEVIDVPGGHHGFETVDHTEPARRAVDRAMRSVLGHLRN